MHLAQLNIAKAKAPMDSPVMEGFVENIDRINGIAESSDGFIWRLKEESGNATGINAFNDPLLLVNMSVWDSQETLKTFMFKTHHLEFMQRKQEWFTKLPEASYVLWWIPKGHIPTLEEAKARLEHIRENGESPYAFSFRSKYTPHDL